MKKQQLFLSILIIAIIALFVLNPKENIDAVLQGIIVWATALLPALFPFFFFTKILTELGFVEKISKYLEPMMKKLYKTNGISAYVYVMSIISGYPVGAKITSDLYESKHLSYGQACRTTTFTSTSGPLFVIGTVAIGMFNSYKMGLIVLFSHLFGALLNGLLYRNYKSGNDYEVKSLTNSKNENVLEIAMLSSVKSILIIGGYIAIFFMIITMLNNYNLLMPLNVGFGKILSLCSLPKELSYGILNGIIEITRGCLDLSIFAHNLKLSTVIVTGVITFGGFSVHLQAYTFLKKFNISFSFYFLQKITHTIISVLLCIVLVLIFF